LALYSHHRLAITNAELPGSEARAGEAMALGATAPDAVTRTGAGADRSLREGEGAVSKPGGARGHAD